MGINYIDKNLQKIANFIRYKNKTTEKIPRNQIKDEIVNLDTSPTSYIGKEKFYAYLGGAYTKLIYNESTNAPAFSNESSFTEVIFPTITEINNVFIDSTSINTAVFDKLELLGDVNYPFRNSSIKNLIIKTSLITENTAPCRIRSTTVANTLKSLKDLKIYVPDDTVNIYKNATNWTLIADKIQPLSDYYSGGENE